jgi:hypothetical protein
MYWQEDTRKWHKCNTSSISRSAPASGAERRRMAGRGAWLHPSQKCLTLAVKRRAFGRALNGATGTADVERRIAAGTTAVDTPVAAAKTVQPESGSEN